MTDKIYCSACASYKNKSACHQKPNGKWQCAACEAALRRRKNASEKTRLTNGKRAKNKYLNGGTPFGWMPE